MAAVYRQSRERTSRALAWTSLICLALTTGGCNSLGPMASLTVDEDVTGSISTAMPNPEAPPLPALSTQDWTIARMALASALDPQGTGAVVSWENPASGARGAMTPVGATYAADGQTCRAFLAEIVSKAPVQRLQGRGCRTGDGQWAVSDLKPFAS